MSIFIILLAVGGAIAVFVMSVYNGLQILKTQITASIQEIGNQLKRQASLIPNLEKSVKAYLKHEKGIFKDLSDARKAVQQADKTGAPADIEAAISKIQNLVPRIQVAVEDNPEIKANKTIMKFMDELTDTADKLMYARRSVIDLSQNYNQRIVTFPSNIVAGVFGFKPEKGLEMSRDSSQLKVSQSDMKNPEVSL